MMKICYMQRNFLGNFRYITYIENKIDIPEVDYFACY